MGLIYLTTVRRKVWFRSRIVLDSLALIAYIKYMDAPHPPRLGNQG
jgi:hypothetical protein